MIVSGPRVPDPGAAEPGDAGAGGGRRGPRRALRAQLTDGRMDALHVLRHRGGQIPYTVRALAEAGIPLAHLRTLRALGLADTGTGGYRWSPGSGRYVRELVVRITDEGRRLLAAYLGEPLGPSLPG